MPETVSFLNTTFKDIRCQNPACQAVASYDNRITLENLLYTGWTCPQRDCGWVHEGAFADPDKIPILPEYGAEPEPPTEDVADIKTIGEGADGAGEVVEPQPLPLSADPDHATDEQLKNRIVELVAGADGVAEVLGYSEVAEALEIGLETVTRLCNELIAEERLAAPEEDDKDA